MHVYARESLGGLDGELQCIAWVACLPIEGQGQRTECWSTGSAGRDGGGSLIRDVQKLCPRRKSNGYTNAVRLFACPSLDSVVLPPVLPGVSFIHADLCSSVSSERSRPITIRILGEGRNIDAARRNSSRLTVHPIRSSSYVERLG